MLMPYFARTMFDEMVDSAFHNRGLGGMMNTDIKENDQNYELVIDLPSVEKEDIAIELKDGYLSISATVNQTSGNDGQSGNYLRRERFSGSCRRCFYVGDRIKQEDIKAKYENGTLHLFTPKQVRNPQLETRNLIAIEG